MRFVIYRTDGGRKLVAGVGSLIDLFNLGRLVGHQEEKGKTTTGVYVITDKVEEKERLKTK